MGRYLQRGFGDCRAQLVHISAVISSDGLDGTRIGPDSHLN